MSEHGRTTEGGTGPTMTGRREQREDGEVVELERRFRAGVDDVWAACTDPARMERWIGTWSGDPASGSIEFRMTAEGEDVPAEVWDIEHCEPPHRLRVRSRDSQPFSEDTTAETVSWRVELELSETDGVTTLRFRQWLPAGDLAADVAASVGPGWEYYLDRLVAAVAEDDVAAVAWEGYESGSAHYRALFT